MIFKILFKYILGYLNISADGYYIERFINTCISKGIFLWNVKRDKSTYMRANVGIKEFKNLKEIAKKTKCKIKIEEKKGLPFIMHRYRKRKIFLALIIVIIVLMHIASKYVWNIEIEGIENINKEEIIQNLSEGGLRVGTLKSKIDTNKIINKIRLERDDVAWININLRGTNVIVKLVETTKKPEIVNIDEYCNIIAKKQAEIIKITAKAGTALVKPGDMVTKDTVLIGGWMEGKYTGTRYVHANRRSGSKSII